MLCGRAVTIHRALGAILLAAVVLAWTSAPAMATVLNSSDGANLIDDAGAGPIAANYKVSDKVPGKWLLPDPVTGLTMITYSFAVGDGYPAGVIDQDNTSGAVYALESFMPFSKESIEAEIRRALDSWEAVANVRFVEVPDDGAVFNAVVTSSGDIRIGGHAFDGVGGTVSHGYFPPVNGFSAAGDVHFDVAETWKIGFGGPGYDIFQSFAHEVGHSLGLDHSDDVNALMYASYSEAFVGPQMDDILGIQSADLYGPLIVQTPEPASWLLAVTALALLGLVRRRR